MNKIKKRLVKFRNSLIYLQYLYKSKWTSKTLPTDKEANFVVSIASYPKRDPLLPAVFQALSRQTIVPQKWILVLSEEDYLNGLPTHLQKLEKRGIEILWVKDNPYAVKKLIPVIEKYAELAVVTLDDDILYHPSLLKGLIDQVVVNPDAVIGYVGKTMLQENGKLHMYYRATAPTNLETKPEQVYLIGWGGIYYPPHSLDDRFVNMQAVHKIVPGRGSDIWFWAAAHAKNTKQVCLGISQNYNLGIPINQNKETKPKDLPGEDIMQNRFQKTIDYFGIREKLLNILPEMSKD